MLTRMFLSGIAVTLLAGIVSASPRYQNEKYCFSIATPAGLRTAKESQDGAGAVFTSGKACGLDDPTCNFVAVSAGYLTYSPDANPLEDLTKKYESDGWVRKSDGNFGPAKGWKEQTLLKGSGTQQREVHIFARTQGRQDPAVGYEIIAEFNSSQRKLFAESVQQVLKSWQSLPGCTP